MPTNPNIVTLASLLSPLPATAPQGQNSWFQSFLSTLQGNNAAVPIAPPFPVTAWQSGSAALDFVYWLSYGMATEDQIVANIAASGFVTLAPGVTTGAAGDWLGLLGENRFQLPRNAATTAILFVTLTATSGATGSAQAPGQITIGTGSASGVQYLFTNIDTAAIVPGQSTSGIRFQAVATGQAYNVGDNQSWTLVTALAGVSATNPPTPPPSGNGTSFYQAGADVQSDASYTVELLSRWATLGTGATVGQYETWAVQFGGGSVTQVGVNSNNGSGTITLTVAGPTPGGNPGAGVVAAVQAAIDPLVPDCVQVNVLPPIPITIQLNGIVRCLSGYQDPATAPYIGAANSATNAALKNYAISVLIGGEPLGPESINGESTGVALVRVTELIEEQTGVQNVLGSSGFPVGPGFMSITTNAPTPPFAAIDFETGDLILQPGQKPLFMWTSGPGASLPFVLV